MTPEQKEWIDSATYEMLLSRWRFAPTGDEMFIGDTGDYYAEVMFEKEKTVNKAQVSKLVGYEK